MKHLSRTKRGLAGGVLLLILGTLSWAAVALADTITGDANSVTSSIDSSVTVASGGSGSGKFALVVNDNNSTDPSNGCNAGTGGTKPPVVLNITSNQSWLTTTQAQVMLTGCDDATVAGLSPAATVDFQVSAAAPADATGTITASYASGGASGGAYTSGSFQVRTPAAPSDTTPPTSSASAKNVDNSTYAFGDWTKQSVTVTLTGSDTGGSGLKEIRYTTDGSTPSASAGTAVSSGSSFTITNEGTTTVKFVAIDNQGNVESPVNERTVKIDKTNPSVNCGSADSAWHGSDVSIGCTASDGPSGLADSNDAAFNLSTNVGSGTETSNASTDGRTVYDRAGNPSIAGPISGNKVDKKAPSVGCGSADGNWHANDVSIACTASDGGSGVSPSSDESFSLSTNVAADTETSNAQTGTKEVSDAVGNKITAGPVGGNKVDKKGPSVACDTPAPSFTLNQWPAKVNGTASDGGSGPATQAVSADADTSSVCSGKTVSVQASDAVGNTGSASCSYSVAYGFLGLFAPIDKPTTMNVSKAGQAIPLKWRLVDASNQPVTNLAAVTVTVQGMSCAIGTTNDAVEEYAAGTSGLQNLGDGYYQFNWKTPTNYAGSCKSISLDFGAGGKQLNLAYITFKK